MIVAYMEASLHNEVMEGPGVMALLIRLDR